MDHYLDEYRNPQTAQKMVEMIRTAGNRHSMTLMEVCGTHTMAVFRFGIRELLPDNIRLLSGPGCPVCVTPVSYIDTAVGLARREDTIIAAFGDVMRVPGGETTLLRERSRGREIRIVYSPFDSLKIAADNPGKKVVFLSVGFETTSPVVALAISKAYETGMANYSVLTANKTMPAALKKLAGDRETKIDGYLYPGHVSAITGTKPYEEIAREYGIPGVIAGFEPVDILYAIVLLVSAVRGSMNTVENAYPRVVRGEGNPAALERMYKVFESCDSVWRGLGNIPESGLKIRDTFADFDARKVFCLTPVKDCEPSGCMCGEVLKGKKLPVECGLFRNPCSPENPVGACMVTSEGTCAAYYRYT